MKPCVLLFALLMLPAVAQHITGTVEKIDKDQLQIKGPKGIVTLHVDEKTAVQKGRVSHDLSALKVGDEIRANAYGDEHLTAVSISAKITISGVITDGNATHITVRPEGAKDTVFVFLRTDTKYGMSKSQLTPGKRVHITGWDSGDGVIDAEKVAVYETDVPLRASPFRP